MRLLAVCAIALAFGFVGSMPLAGPIAIMVVSRGARGRFRDALHIGLGAAVAEALYAGVAFFGYTTLLAEHPIVVPVSHAATAVLLAGIGVRFLFWRAEERQDPHQKSAGTALVGFTITAFNPTLLVTWGAAVAFLYSKGLGVRSALGAIPFGASAGAGVGSWFALLVRLLRKWEGKVPRRFLTWLVRSLGLALIGLGAWSGVQLVEWLRGEG